MSASAHARLLLIGIWTEAWDDGVFEWKPIVLKARIFPADQCDVPALMEELEGLGFFKRFAHGGKSFGLVRNFRKFQRPKKPNCSGVFPSMYLEYVGLEQSSSEPIRNHTGTSSEKSSQMEDGGGRMEDGKEPSSIRAKGFEARCREAVQTEPVAIAIDFNSISDLLADGVTEADVLTGIAAAMATRDFRPRNWKQLVGWARKAAKDRMAGVAKPTLARDGPRKPASPSNVSLAMGIINDRHRQSVRPDINRTEPITGQGVSGVVIDGEFNREAVG